MDKLTEIKKKFKKWKGFIWRFFNLIKTLDSELKILVGSLAFIFLFILITKIPLFNNPFLLNNYNDLSKVISTNAKIIATIFAITISLTLLGFQYLSRNISPKILYSFFKSKFIVGMITLYAFSILFNIFVLSFSKNHSLVYFSYVLLALCVMYLISYIYFMVNNLQPQKILKQIEKNISKHDYGDKNYVILEQTIIKAIRNNDFFTFSDSLIILFKKQQFFLNELLHKEINEKYNYDSRHSDTEKVIYSFLRMQNQIYFEIIKERNEIFLTHYLDNLRETHIWLLKLMAIRPYRVIREHFNDIGFDIIRLKLRGVYDYYCRCLDKISKEEFNSIPSGNLFLEFQDKTYLPKGLSKLERSKRTLKHIIFNYFTYDRQKFLIELSEKASDNKIEHFILLIKVTLSDLLISSINKGDNKKMRFYLVNTITRSLTEIHSYSINKGIDMGHLGVLDLHHYLEDMTEETINTLGLHITKCCCFAEIESAKKDFFRPIFSLGVSGRTLVNKKGFEKIMDELINCLIKILDISIKNKGMKHVKKDSIARELFSIRDWGNHKNNVLKNKIDEIIKKYNLKNKKLF